MNTNNSFKYKRVDGNPYHPVQGYKFDAGWDIKSPTTVILPPHKTTKCMLGLVVIPPHGCYTRTANKSSLGLQSLIVTADIVDPGYNGEICVLLHNLGNSNFEIKKGEKITQLVFEKFEAVEAVEMDKNERDEDNEGTLVRGNRGFGSSGK